MSLPAVFSTKVITSSFCIWLSWQLIMGSFTDMILPKQWRMADLSAIIPFQQLLPTLPAICVVFYLALGGYRLIFHPLAGFPGPRWAAVSTWWIYFRFKSGELEPTLRELHREYNTRVLRIGPNELHVDDVSIYDQIYSSKGRFLKHDFFYAGFNAPSTAFTECLPALHRERRKLISQFFSRQGIVAVEHLLNSNVDMAIEKIREYNSQGPIYLHRAIRCMTVDIITGYAFGEPFGLINQAKDNKFEVPVLMALDLLMDAFPDLMYFPLLRRALNIVPIYLLALMSRTSAQMVGFYKSVDEARAKFTKAQESGVKFARPPVFESLSSLNRKDMTSEGVDIVVAGADTTATTLATLFNFVLRNHDIEKKLMAELDRAIPDRNSCPSLIELEKLDYLSACVKEGLRIAMPVPGRLPRIVPETEPDASPFMVDGKLIPAGSIIGMSAATMHNSEELWGEDAMEFRPERWLQPDSKQLDKYFVPFSKGARQCLGINLAYAELRIATAKLFRRFKFSLDPTMTDKDTHLLDQFTMAPEGTGVRCNIEYERT